MTEIAALAQEGAVDERTLRRAIAVGALHARRKSPRRIELTLGERAYIRRSWRLISTLRAALRTERNVRFALLFGSAAVGGDTLQSDVDLLIELRDASLVRVIDLKAKLAGLIGRPVDLVLLSDAKKETSFLAQAIADGRVLIDREGTWDLLRRRESTLRREGKRADAVAAKNALAAIDRMFAA